MGISVVEFEKALTSLQEALEALGRQKNDPVQHRLVRDATVQRFEFSIELAWKVSAKILGSTSTAAKPVIREMAQNTLIDNPDLWFDFIEARNKTSHAYDENVAEEVVRTANLFQKEASRLLLKLKTK